ncbi:dihydroorotase [SAR86 cluster bacterium]|nr:dihydroorotase [SAR86 cluster bacterium]RZO97917.1 MAG: dihydroorotase [Gammaproteobacteria bacterium]
MSNFDLVLKNCLLINEGQESAVDIGIKKDRIEKIASEIREGSKQVIDLEGKHTAPGIIDDQVHFRDPGLTEKGDIRSESLAAVHSGVTSTFDMPNVNPNTTTMELLAERNQLGAEKSWTNYSYYFGATETNLEEIKKLDPKETCGLKVFMGTSTGTLLVEDDNALEQIFKHCPVTIVTHCEDNDTMKANLEKVKLQNEKIDASFHPIIKDDICCYRSSSKVINLAKKHGSDLHVLHLTTEKEIELFDNIATKDKKITCEVCVHHLWFDERDYGELGNLIVCNPAIKKESDRNALRKALKEGYIDFVATDHAPHVFEDKKLPYLEASAGIPLIEHSFQIMIELHKQGYYSLSEVISYMSHKVADRFSIKDRGYIREGYKADFMIFDLNKETLVSNETELTKCGWTPFNGKTFSSSVYGTIINGQPIVIDGKLVIDKTVSEKLKFDR